MDGLEQALTTGDGADALDCLVALNVELGEKLQWSTLPQFDRFMAEHGKGRTPDEMMGYWAQHPYAPEVQGGLPRNWSEDPWWDQHFPQHPLSRARRLLQTMAPTIEVHPAFHAAPPWRG